MNWILTGWLILLSLGQIKTSLVNEKIKLYFFTWDSLTFFFISSFFFFFFFFFFRYSFPCNDWLSFDKGDGSIIRQLQPHSNQFNNLFADIKTRIHIGLFDDHLYFSIVKRPRSSPFTRLQRLSTLVAVLYLSLISSAMYYKPTDKIPSRAFTLGPFTFTSKEIIVGLISSVIMVIPASVIINLFRWRKTKGEESDTCERSLTIGERLKRFRLPWWSVYLAYVLVFLSISVSAYFTFMYSIVWGKELALQWLLSVFINVIGSVILIQPVKVSNHW